MFEYSRFVSLIFSFFLLKVSLGEELKNLCKFEDKFNVAACRKEIPTKQLLF